MKSWTRDILVALAAGSVTFLVFGLLVSFDFAVSFWYVPLVACLATGIVMHMIRRRARSIK